MESRAVIAAKCLYVHSSFCCPIIHDPPLLFFFFFSLLFCSLAHRVDERTPMFVGCLRPADGSGPLSRDVVRAWLPSDRLMCVRECACGLARLCANTPFCARAHILLKILPQLRCRSERLALLASAAVLLHQCRRTRPLPVARCARQRVRCVVVWELVFFFFFFFFFFFLFFFV